MAASDCKHFTGYKPCGKSSLCDELCPSYFKPQISILIIHLGALGAVVRSTSLLKAIKRKYPSSIVTWVTDAPADRLLQNHPLIDRVMTSAEKDLLQLAAVEFDIAYVIDKSLKAVGVLKKTTVDQVYGFTADPKTGAILPATEAARELWLLGLNNHQKFFVNQKPETQLMVEALELGPWLRDDYFLPLSTSEELAKVERRDDWSHQGCKILVGLNTGCSSVIAHKKLSIEMHRRVIQNLTFNSNIQIVLLGGPEDTERNSVIAQGLPVINTNTESGLRDGLVSVAACDVVLTGDSLGMHMAISQKKYVVAWFGPTCAQEIDLYDRGSKILAPVTCSPCWKRDCSRAQMCYDQVSEQEIIQAIQKGIEFVRESHSSNSLPGRSTAEYPAF